MVVCDVEVCVYRSKDRFCTRKLLKINSNGSCGTIYDKNGNVRANWNVLNNNQVKQEKIIEGKEVRAQVDD